MNNDKNMTIEDYIKKIYAQYRYLFAVEELLQNKSEEEIDKDN